MFGAIKKLFQKSRTELPAETSYSSTVETHAAVEEMAAPALEEESSQLNTLLPPPVKAAPAFKAPPLRPASSDTVTVSFAAIVQLLPKETLQRTTVPGLDKAWFSMPIKAVLQQLSTGSVRVTVRELRKAAPLGLFSKSTAQDEQLVALPLAEIIPQLPTERFSHGAPRRRVEVPSDVGQIFTNNGEQLSPVRLLDKNETPAATPKVARPLEPKAPQVSPPGAAVTPVRPVAKTFTKPTLAARAAAPTPPREVPKPIEAERIRLPLSELLEGWPEPIRLEIANQNFKNGVCGIPVAVLREGMKQPKVVYPWKQLRAWIDPAPSGPSAYGELSLELPTKVLASHLQNMPGRPVAAPKLPAADIPDVFSRAAAPAAPVAPAPAPAAAAPAPLAQSKPTLVTHTPIPFAGFSQVSPKAPAKETKEIKEPVLPRKVVPTLAPPSASVPTPTSTPAPAPVAVAPAAPVVVPVASAAVEGKPVISIPLATVKGAWPESLQQEIESYHLAGGTIEVPVESIEASLKSGKVSFPWKQIWIWLKPSPSGQPAHCHSDLRLDMALEVVAPLYLAQRPKPVVKKQATVINIPDLFNAAGPTAPTAEPAPAPVVAAPASTAPVRATAESAVRKVPQNLSELFGVADKRSWTPNEIVHQTSTLPGVAGSLIALQDGLLVASCMPPNWKTETIAAFLPQIFGRLRQYSKELDMGDLVSASFGVEQGVFQVFNAGIIYFAAVAQPGHVLPIPELQVIAQELSRHTK